MFLRIFLVGNIGGARITIDPAAKDATAFPGRLPPGVPGAELGCAAVMSYS
jgi:hypothetical protein